MRHTSHTTRHTAPYDVSYTVIRRFNSTLTTHCKWLTFKWKFTFENLQLFNNASAILYTLYTLTHYSSTITSTVYYTSTIVCKPLKSLSFFIILCFQTLIVYSSTSGAASLGAGVSVWDSGAIRCSSGKWFNVKLFWWEGLILNHFERSSLTLNHFGEKV